MSRRLAGLVWVCVALLGGLTAPQARAQDAAAAATKIEKILAQTEAYWAAKHADDIVTIARESRTFASAIATAAESGQIDDAKEAFAKMNARCNACHDLHPEKR